MVAVCPGPAGPRRKAEPAGLGRTGRDGRIARVTSPPPDVSGDRVDTGAVLGGTSLAREAQAIGRLLDDGDLAARPPKLPALCGRDPTVDAAGWPRARGNIAENPPTRWLPVLWGASSACRACSATARVNPRAMIGTTSTTTRGSAGAAAAREGQPDPGPVTGSWPGGWPRAVRGRAPGRALRSFAATAGQTQS